MLLELCGILKSIRYDALPEFTVEKAKITILNYLGISLDASSSPITKAERSVWEEAGGVGECVIIGQSGGASPLAAASVNALMGQIYLLEDCHEHTLSHPGVNAIPVALALGQSRDAGGKKIIEAVVAAYESMGRIGSVLIAPGFPDYGLRPASALAPFGGVAAAAMVMGLDAGTMRDAFSIVGNTSSGVMEFVNSGAEDICIQNCFAAKNSIMAAMLAENGVAGSPAILDGMFGLGAALNRRELDWRPAVAPHSGHYMIDDSFVKRHPGCGHVLATAQAAESLISRYKIELDDIDKVIVGVSQRAMDFPGTDNPGPFNGAISAMMSHQFMVASALVRGEVSVGTINDFGDPSIADVARKVSVEFDKQIDDAFPGKTGARLSVLLKNGEKFVDFQEDLIPMSKEDVVSRFMQSAERRLPAGRAGAIADIMLNLESLRSVNDLMPLLSCE